MPSRDDRRVRFDRELEDLDAAALTYAEHSTGASPGRKAGLRDELVRYCLPLAGRLARRYRGRGEPLDDLEQVARLGLVNAVDRYDPMRGSFTAYAVITITGEIKRHFRDKTWAVHVPRRVQDLSLEVSHATLVLTNSLSRAPTAAEIAERLEVSEAEVTDALESAAGYSSASLSAPIGGDGTHELGDLVGEADAELEAVDNHITVAGLLSHLPDREQRMLAMRFYGNRTQAEIAAEFGLSQMHVSRLLSRALGWLREAMTSDVLPRWSGTDVDEDMEVAILAVDGVLTVRVRGEVDRDTARRLQRVVRDAMHNTGAERIMIDLSGVGLLDAAGIAVLMDAALAACVAGARLRLVGARPHVVHVLTMSGLAEHLDDRRAR
jgi:RNA polymerase sigma-B factor